VAVQHRVVFGTRERVNQALVVCGRKINTAFVERLNLDIRQRVAAVGRRVNTLCQGEDGLRQQLVVYHAYDISACLTPVCASCCGLPTTNGRGSAKVWRPCTPANGGGIDRPCVVAQRGVALSGAAVAAAADGLRTGRS